MYVWGLNDLGQLGLGDFTNRSKPTLNSFFKNQKIMKIVCGELHCLALFGKWFFIWFIFLENGEVYSWGDNEFGQLGHGDKKKINTPTLISFFKGMNVMDVFAFSYQSFVLLGIYFVLLISKFRKQWYLCIWRQFWNSINFE